MKTISKKIKNVNRIAIYENLHFGGASVIAELINRRISNNFRTSKYSDSDIKPKNFVDYLFLTYISIPLRQYALSKMISEFNQLLIAHHSWITKSPYLLFFSKIPKIYICQESPREFYEQEHKSLQTLKEKIVNLLRIHIKIFDLINMRSKHMEVIVNSKFSKRQIDRIYGIKSVIIYPGIDTSIYIKQKHKYKKLNQIISIGAINKLKNQMHIIKSVSKIKGQKPKVLLIGNSVDPKYFETLVKEAKRNQIELEIKTNVSREQKIRHLAESQAFIYCPVNEPFGVVVEEAMACGLPLIVYAKGGGYREIINNKNGLIINDLNPEKWAIKIKKLLSNKQMLNYYSKNNSRMQNLRRIDFHRMGDELLKIIEHKLVETYGKSTP